MDETQGRTSVIGRIFARFTGNGDEEIVEDDVRSHAYDRAPEPSINIRERATHLYQVTIRKSLVSFEEAVEAADGLRRGEQQVINVVQCQPDLREKILNFLFGAAHMADAEMHELGDHVWLFSPASAFVDLANPVRGRSESTYSRYSSTN